MPVYQKFCTSVQPFTRVLPQFREAFWRDDNCYIYEWYDQTTQRGEKFGLDYNSITYFYESWFIEGDLHVVEKSWLRSPVEWGVVIRYYPDHEEKVAWTLDGDHRVLEEATKSDERTDSKKEGKQITPEGLEDFTERFWETPTDSGREKVWTREDAKGEEKEYKEGDKKWGESWSTGPNNESKKEWHDDGRRKWGQGEGKTGYENYKDHWEKNSQGSLEEIDIEDRGLKRGKLRVRSKSNEYKLEWLGTKPKLIIPGSEEDRPRGPTSADIASQVSPLFEELRGDLAKRIEVLKEADPLNAVTAELEQIASELRSIPEPQGTGENGPLSGFQGLRTVDGAVQAVEKELLGAAKNGAFQVGALFGDLRRDIAKRIDALRAGDTNGAVTAELDSLASALRAIEEPRAFDAPGALAAIQKLREIDSALVPVEVRLIGSIPQSDQLRELFNEAREAAVAVQPLLDAGNISETPQELQHLTKEFEKSNEPREQIRAIGGISPLIKAMVRASKRQAEDTAREIAALTEKLNAYMKEFEEAIKNSQKTLTDIERNFKPEEETVKPICEAYVTRAKAVVEGIELATPYTQMLPMISNLLTDMEKFKREMMDAQLRDKIRGLATAQEELRSHLAEEFKVPIESLPVFSVDDPESLSRVVQDLERQEEITRALVYKLLGKDVPTGVEAVDKIPVRDPNERLLPIDAVNLLKFFWVNGKAEQDRADAVLNTLAEALGTEDEKARVSELIEEGQKAVCGVVPETRNQALEGLKESLEIYIPNQANKTEILEGLVDRTQKKIKEMEVKPEEFEALWKALMLSERIAEKLLRADPPASLEELRKVVEALPSHPVPAEMYKHIIKYQEINLDLINMDEALTAEEVKEIDAAAKLRAAGKGKAKGKGAALGKKGARALRSGKGGAKRMDFTEPARELIESSHKTTGDLAMWLWGPRPNVAKHLEDLKAEKEPVLELVQKDFTSEETIDKLLSLLKKYEDEKIGIMGNSTIGNSLLLVFQKCQKVLETTGKVLNTPVPSEASELIKRKPTGDLTDVTKRIGFLLSVFFKMVKEVTGVDEGGENLDDALSAYKKKQAISILPFDPLDLLRELKSKNDSDIRRLKFLSGLVGTEEEVVASAELEARAHPILHDLDPKDNQEAMEHIDTYLKTYPPIEGEISTRTEQLLSLLLERLCNPEPLESDVGCLIEASERLDAALAKLSKATSLTPPEIQSLTLRKDEIPTSPKMLMPYMTQLVRDFSRTNLDLVAALSVQPVSAEEDRRLLRDIEKKRKAAPVQIVRDIQHLFRGPETEEMLEVIVKINRTVQFLLKKHSVSDPALYSECTAKFAKLEQLTPKEIKELGIEYCEVMLGFIDIPGAFDDFLHEIDDDVRERQQKRSSSKVESTARWEDIFKARGLDINGALMCELLHDEQKLAVAYLEAFTGVLGSPEQRSQCKHLAGVSADLVQEYDEARKIEHYMQLRFEESKLMSSMHVKLTNVNERLTTLDKEKENSIALGINEVGLLLEKNNPELKEQLQIIINKEEQNKSKRPENLIERVLLLNNRLGLEKELQRIKDEAKPTDNSEAEFIQALTVLQGRLYGELKSVNTFLQDMSQELNSEVHTMKHLTEPQVATTIPALLASLDNGITSYGQIVQGLEKAMQESPVKTVIGAAQKMLEAEANADDGDTEVVFSGLLRLCGNSDDKARSRKLREARSLVIEEKGIALEKARLLEAQLAKFMPNRSAQSKLQGKLVREAEKMRDGIDDLDLQTEDIMTKTTREVANSILADDSRSRDTLDSIKKGLEEINESSPTNIPECIDRIAKRLELTEKLERLRRDLRERASKEINRLKGEIQDKLNDLATAKATIDGQKTQYEAQIMLLQNTAELNASLVEKLTQESMEKERALSALKNTISDLKNESEQDKEDLQKLQEEVDSNNKELRNLRRVNKEKEAQIRDLQSSLDGFERNTEKSSLGDKEKSEVLEKQKSELTNLRQELAGKVKNIDELEDEKAAKERFIKKLEMEKENLEKELEKVSAERNKIKADLIRINTEKADVEEKMRMNEGVNPDEIKHLERILRDKQAELEESEANLVIARRYQLLYPELTLEKQEVESKLKDTEIEAEDLRRKLEAVKQENDQNKFKLSSLENIQNELADLQKEKEKLQLRLNYIEQSSGASKDITDAAKQASEALIGKENDIAKLLEEIEKLKKELEDQQDKYKKSLTRSFLVRLCHTFKEMQGERFRKWRNMKTVLTGPNIDFSIVPVVPVIAIPDEEKPFDADYQAADEAISALNKDLIDSNRIIQSYKSLENKAEKPMSYINVFKFLEDMMSRKFDADKQCVNDGKPISSIPEFVLESLMKTYGIQSLALKFLAQFIAGFHAIYADGHPYAIFFARLLQIFHSDPISFSLAVYLVKVRMDFHTLIDRYERIQIEHGKKDILQKADAYGRSAYEAAGTGGLAQLGDAIELIYTLFAGDKEAGEKALELLRPGKVSIEDFVAFKICHKMAKLGKTPEMIFTLLDKDQGGTIDVGEFITGTKGDLDLWISDTNVTKLLVQLDTSGTGEISKEAFMEKINMKFLIECNKSNVWVVTKANFLIALVEVAKYKQRKVLAHLHPKCISALEQEAFNQIIAEYDPNSTPENTEKLFEEAKHKEEAADFANTGDVICKYGMGEMKPFKNRELVQEVNRRKLGSFYSDKTTVDTLLRRTSFVSGDVKIEREEEEKTTIRKKVTKKLVKKPQA